MRASHPGKVLLEQYLAPRSLSQNRLARHLGVPPRRINEIILGKRAISADTAVRLACAFGNSAGYWLHLQAQYDIQRVQQKMGARLTQITPLTSAPDHPRAPRKATTRIRRRLMR